MPETLNHRVSKRGGAQPISFQERRGRGVLAAFGIWYHVTPAALTIPLPGLFCPRYSHLIRSVDGSEVFVEPSVRIQKGLGRPVTRHGDYKDWRIPKGVTQALRGIAM